MGIFADLQKALTDLITTLPTINADNRKQIRDVVLQLESELDRALILATVYLDGVPQIKPDPELLEYLQSAPSKLMDSFNQFKICAGLYGLADRFDQVFSTVRGSIAVQNLQTVENLIRQLSHGESIIVYELRDMTDTLANWAHRWRSANKADFEQAKSELYKQVSDERDRIQKRRRWLARTVKSILKGM